MKVAVITRHAINNYGSILQALATQSVIEKIGHESIIIDYVRHDESVVKREKTELQKKDNWNSSKLKRMLYLTMRQPESIFSGMKFERMQKKYLHLTKRYSDKEELLNNKPSADFYMTGSDQVWGPVGSGEYDDCYCLSFTDEDDKRVSYAASFGHTEFTPELERYFKKWLNRYDKILVREESAKNKINDLGFLAYQVIDPTLLLSRDYWKRFSSKRRIKEKYILVYQLHKNNQLGKYAKELAQKEGLKLIRVSQYLHQITQEGRLIWCPDIGEFLSLIENAECIITDSFHGTAFAINFNTPFIEVLPENNTATRNISILNLTGLNNRILMDNSDYGIIKQQINFDVVNQIIENERKRSMELLEEAIKLT